MAVGSTALLLGALGIGGGVAASKAFIPSQKISAPTPLPQPPSVEATADKASDIIKRKRASATQTVYSSPLGLSGEANVAKKVLLGQ